MEQFNNRNEIQQYMEKIKEKLNESHPVAEILLKKYTEIEEKLPEDMKSLATQYLLLFGMMLEEAEQDRDFASQILLEWKTWDRLYRYMDSKARPTSEKNKNFRPRCAAVDSFTLLEWIKEYYALDDKEEYEKELDEKAAAEEKHREFMKKIEKDRKKREVAAKKRTTNTESKGTESEEEEDTSEEEKDNETEVEVTEPTEKPVTIKKSAKDCEGQMDFFSMFAD